MEQLEVRSTDNIKNTPIKKTKEYDEPFLFFALSNIAFSAGTFLLGLINFYSYNPLFLTIFGFWFPGWGQALGGIMSYKIKYYMDGNIYFFFAINWFCNFCYDLFPIWGWMRPLNHIEYGLHNLVSTLFLIAFLIQNLLGKSHLSKVISFFNLLGFIFTTIGNFTDSITTKKLSGIVNFIISPIAYYNGIALIINQKRNRITFPLFDGKVIGDKLN
jgi:succinate-acetate transporter protein